MRLSPRRLNRTLLARQHLLERADTTTEVMVEHLVGLQAQDNLPPFLSLAARLETFDPYDVTRGLESDRLVRLGTLRGTLHLHTAADAVRVKGWVRARHGGPVVRSTGTPVVRADRAALKQAVDEALADGPLPQRELADALTTRIGGVPASALGVLAREVVPMVQLPPRGTWKGSGGPVYDLLERRVGAPVVEPDAAGVQDLVRRYLRAFGPATAGDVSIWCGRTRLGPVVKAMPDLVRHEDEGGKPLLDVADGLLADEDAPAPVRLLGLYDNLWLAHADRGRVTGPRQRGRWMGPNGGVAHTVFVDGELTGLWKVVDERVDIIETFRSLTSAERSELDDEISLVDDLLSR